ncbi:RNA polymerase sigma factor [Novosphingobium sp. KN65.2]|uniref:RNA polymerase sigma factor n=1 Tax=Novosphingobium sp. KN65.2 TaxID=1478134 RepID=UPI0005E7D290|nr:RNA polymerase sigma factor [Novosphingobium sp. KN65.2]CDO36043.1 RNA polymerase sigma factor, sigma-70 family [Novosphingobium sp. KN65.2]
MRANLESLPSGGPASEQEDWGHVQTGLIRYLRARAVRADVAEDIAQETLIRLISVSRKQAVASVFALGFRIADNLLVDLYRAERRLTDAPGDDMRSEAPSLDRVLDSRRAYAVFQQCLDRMPPLRREVIVRRRMRQESCRAIGEALSLSIKAVEKHITRGLLDLRRAMEKAGIEPAGWDE